MLKKYKFVPIFDENKTVEVESSSSIESGISILSKKLKEIEDETGIPHNINKSLVIMVNKKNGDPLQFEELSALEDIFANKAIIITGISDLSGSRLEEIEENN